MSEMPQPFHPEVRAETSPLAALRYRDRLYAVDLLGAAIVEFDFFSWASARESFTEAEICAEFGFAPRPVDVMVTLFVANDFLQREGGSLRVTRSAEEYLVEGSPWCLKPYYGSLSDRPVLKDMMKVLRSGKPATWGSTENEKEDWHKAMEREDFAQKFTAAMDCRGMILGQALAAQLDLGGRSHLLDIGGGSGIYACILAKANPGLRATVLDKSPVDQVAARAIAQRGCEELVDVVAGDMFETGWPEADVHLWSNVLHDWDVPELAELLKRSAEQLPKGGLLVIHDAFINAEKTGPLAVAEYSALLMNVTQGKCYATSEYEAQLAPLGFKDFRYEDTTGDRGFLTAIKS